jgi:hypothetical protein
MVTPELAREYLATNIENNRPIVIGKVDMFTRLIKSGKWVLTHQGIAFDEKGRLIDGQHRLSAIAKSGMTVPVMVTMNVPKNAIMAMDQGTARKPRDVMKLKYGNGIMSDNTLISCVRFMISNFVYKKITYSTQEIEAYMLDHINALTWLYANKAFGTHKRHVAGLRTCGFLCALLAARINGVSDDALEQFQDLLLYNNLPSIRYSSKAALMFKDKLQYAYKDAMVLDSGEARKKTVYDEAKGAIWLFVQNRTRFPKNVDPSDLYPITDEQIRAFGSEAKEAAL